MGNLTVIIPFFNGHTTIFRLLESLPPDLSVIIVDDVSDRLLEREARLATMQRNGTTAVLRLRQKGYFAGAVNVGIQNCTTDVLVLNQDVWFEDDRWVGLIDDWRNEGAAMIGERIKGDHPAFPNGYIHGTFMFLRRDAIEKVGLLNAKDYPLWGNTAEWQWRAARQGFAVLPLTQIPGLRHERRDEQRYGASITQLLTREPEKQDLLIRTPPLVSVIVPCHNYGRFLPDCIASLIGGNTSLGPHSGQTLQSFEVIIVDDASTDETPEIAAGLFNGWNGIRYFRLDDNVGTARALNYGIERAVGQYITFLSADDMREPDSLEKMVRACEEQPHSFAYDDIQMFGSGKRLRPWRMQEFDFELLLNKNHVHAGILYPRQAWVEAGGYPAAMNDGREDWAFNIALGQKGWCGVHVRHFGYLYRREGQNRSLTNTSHEHHARFLDKIRGIFPHLYEGRRPVGCCGGKKTSQSKTANHSAQRQAAPQMMTGATGMVKLEYLGKQMSSVWSGHASNTPYRFGADKPVGWVDVRDAGERPSEGRQGSGFLKLRKNGEWLFAPYVEEDVAEPAHPVVAGTENESLALVVTSDATAVVDPAEDGTTAKSQAETPDIPTTEEDFLLVDVESETQEMPVVEEAEANDGEGGGDVTFEGTAETVTEVLGAFASEPPGDLNGGPLPRTDVPDPNTLTVNEIRGLDLSPAQWNELRQMELGGQNRRGVLDHVEKILAP